MARPSLLVLYCPSALEGFEASRDCPCGSVLLIDDIQDSRWTVTVCGALLRRAGTGDVYPFALASTATMEGGEG